MTSTASKTLMTTPVIISLRPLQDGAFYIPSLFNIGTLEMCRLTSWWITSMTGVSILAVWRFLYVPRLSSLRGFRRSWVSCTLTATNLRIRYCVTTLTTIARLVSSSTSTNGIRRDRDSSMRRHASYRGRKGWIETVSIGLTPMALSMSIMFPQHSASYPRDWPHGRLPRRLFKRNWSTRLIASGFCQ